MWSYQTVAATQDGDNEIIAGGSTSLEGIDSALSVLGSHVAAGRSASSGPHKAANRVRLPAHCHQLKGGGMRLKSVVPVVLALLLSSVPVIAADAPTAVTGALSWQHGEDTGRTYTASVDLNFPLTRILSLGPAVRTRYWSSDVNPDPADTGSLTLTEVGGSFTMYTTKSHNGFQLGVAAYWPLEDLEGDYLVEPYVGVEFGSEAAFVRARLSHPLQYGKNGGETIDLERDEVTAGFGWRF